MSVLINNINSIAKRLQSVKEDQTSSIEHNLMKGMMRESALKDALRDLVPQKYEFGSGIIVDAHGSQSLQQDFILYDAFSSPSFLTTEKDVVLPVESVYATVEVKSNLNTRDLRAAVKNFKSIQELEINAIKHSYLPVTGNNKIMGCVFAYSSDISLSTLTNNLVEMNKDIPTENRLGCICILDKGNIVNVRKDNWRVLHTMPSDHTTCLIKENTLEQNLYLFYLLLQSHLNYALNLPPDLWKYSQISGDYIDKGIQIPLAAITDDLKVPLPGNYEVSGSEYKRFTKMMGPLYKALRGELTADDIIKSGLSESTFEHELKWATEFFKEMTSAFFKRTKKENNDFE